MLLHRSHVQSQTIDDKWVCECNGATSPHSSTSGITVFAHLALTTGVAVRQFGPAVDIGRHIGVLVRCAEQTRTRTSTAGTIRSRLQFKPSQCGQFEIVRNDWPRQIRQRVEGTDQ